MLNCQYEFLESNHFIQICNSDFDKKKFTFDALIQLTDKIREQLDK